MDGASSTAARRPRRGTLDKRYDAPAVQDYGTLIDLTAAGNVVGFEDAGPKFSLLDVS
jgi:hypothetical protein